VRFYFGSARTKKKIHLLAEKIAYKISKAGYGYYRRGLALWKRVTKGASGRWNFSGIEYCIAV
jgi:hypothetical protein